MVVSSFKHEANAWSLLNASGKHCLRASRALPRETQSHHSQTMILMMMAIKRMSQAN
jgi:hypothetical protein